jgi:hypothetical protein
MTKLVVLRLDGDVKYGLKVTLEIGLEGERPDVEIQGRLPARPDLEQCLSLWQESYRSLDIPTRLVPKQTIYGKPVGDLINQCSRAAYQLGERLREWLESKDFRAINNRLREELNRKENIHVLIRAENDQLTRLPWHLWDFFASYTNAEISFSTSAYQRVNRTKPKQLKDKVKILAILGNSAGIDVQTDRLILRNLPNADVVFLVEPNRRELDDKLWSQAWDILFFAGHSETIRNRGKIHINPQESLEIENLKYGLRKALDKGLRLVILNSCDGLGLAHDLEQLCIPQLIVMREPIPDQVAQEFLKSFLQSFSNGKSLHGAMREARERLEGLEDKFPCATWLPVLFQNPAETPPTWMSLLGKDQDRVDLAQETSYSLTDETETYTETTKTQETTLKQAPPFGIEAIKPISEVICSNESGELDSIGTVERDIFPGYLGQIKYNASFWSACLYPINDPNCWKPLSPGQEVKVIGVVASNKLVVIPADYVLAKPKQQSSFSSLRAFFGIF